MKKLVISLIVVFAGYSASGQAFPTEGNSTRESSEIVFLQTSKTKKGTSFLRHQQSVFSPKKRKDVIPTGHARIILTAGDVWMDGTGYQMLLDTHATAYGTIIPTGNYLAQGDVPSTTYDEFEYKIPVNADGLLNTLNIVLNNSISIDIPAGIYDYCITNPDPNSMTMWIALGAYSVGDDFEFEEGHTYSFTMVYNAITEDDSAVLEIDYGADIDANVLSITAPVSGTDLTNAEIVKAIIKNNGTSPISGFSLELKVNGTSIATENYAGSIAAGTTGEHTFAATADLSADGNHIVTVIVNLTGDEIPLNDTLSTTIKNTVCYAITTFPWKEGFNNGIPDCWIAIDADQDGNNWTLALVNGDTMAMSRSYDDNVGALTPDNFLITPQITLDADYSLSFDVGSMSDYYAEKYSVLISTTGNMNETDFTVIHTETLTERGIKTVVLPLTAYIGESVYIAFRHWDCTDMYALVLDNIRVFDFNNHIDAQVKAITEPVTGVGLTNAETVTTTIKNNGGTSITGFSLQLDVDGTTIATETYSGTIASLAEEEYTFTATADLSAEGYHTVKVSVILANDMEASNDTLSVTIANVTCDAITLPLIEDFESISYLCWEAVQGSASTTNVLQRADMTAYDGSYSWMFTSFTETDDDIYDQYLISPELPLTTESKFISFYYLNQLSVYDYKESFMIGYSTTDNSIENFTWFEEVTDSSASIWTYYAKSNIPANAKHIAIRYTSYNSSYLIIDKINITEAVSVNLVSVYPANDAANVAVNASLVVEFDGNITALDLSLITLFPDLGTCTGSIQQGKFLNISHNYFEENTRYTVNVPAGSILEYNQDITWSFTTGGSSNIQELSPSEINIYPNPAKDIIYIESSVKIEQAAIYDISGRMLKQIINPSQEINVSGLANGIYLVKVKTGQGESVHKIIK
jgi:hypothetical protein